MKTQRERKQEERTKKLEEIAEQVADGRLRVRAMTDEERRRYAPPLGGRPAPRRRSY